MKKTFWADGEEMDCEICKEWHPIKLLQLISIQGEQVIVCVECEGKVKGTGIQEK